MAPSMNPSPAAAPRMQTAAPLSARPAPAPQDNVAPAASRAAPPVQSPPPAQSSPKPAPKRADDDWEEF